MHTPQVRSRLEQGEGQMAIKGQGYYVVKVEQGQQMSKWCKKIRREEMNVVMCYIQYFIKMTDLKLL